MKKINIGANTKCLRGIGLHAPYICMHIDDEFVVVVFVAKFTSIVY